VFVLPLCIIFDDGGLSSNQSKRSSIMRIILLAFFAWCSLAGRLYLVA
jgi:hypothetical protein